MDKLPRIIKWVGSKWGDSLTLPDPSTYDALVDPFCGALGFELGNWGQLSEKEWHLSDYNPHLIKALQAVIENPDGATEYLKGLFDSNSPEQFYRLRSELGTGNPLDFLYLVQSSYRGVPRLNRSGGYNSPYNPKSSFPVERFRETAIALSGKPDICITCRDASQIAVSSERTFLFLDPPYAGKGLYLNPYTVDSSLIICLDLIERFPQAQILFTYGCEVPELSRWNVDVFRRSHGLRSSKTFTQYFYRNY